jgi:hypothetical protein
LAITVGSYPTWPTTLPQRFLMNGFQHALGDNRAVFRPQSGAPVVRRVSSYRQDPIQGQMRVTDSQLATFRSFYSTDCSDGTTPFTWVDPETGAAQLMRFGTGGTPSWTPAGPRWMVSFAVETLPS